MKDHEKEFIERAVMRLFHVSDHSFILRQGPKVEVEAAKSRIRR